jgi:hypothetical protein
MTFARVAGTLAVLCGVLCVGSCRGIRRDPPPRNEVDDCLSSPFVYSRTLEPGDPMGQGSDLLGLGFIKSDRYARADRFPSRPEDVERFATVDQFDTARVVSADNFDVLNVGIKSFALEGEVQRGSMTTLIEGTAWKGAVLKGSLRCKGRDRARTEITLRIRNVVQKPSIALHHGAGLSGGGVSWAYDLELWHPDLRRWVAACRDPDDMAFPIPGYWRDNGRYDRESQTISFACVQRDVAKCLRNGYAADAVGTSDDVKLFDACTRMMRADYCGNGDSYTVDGTLVRVSDNRYLPPSKVEAPLSFEAAWRPTGVACINRPRWMNDDLRQGHRRVNPSCLEAVPRCETADEARRLFPDKVLLFSESCEKHPCEVKLPGPHTISEPPLRGTVLPGQIGSAAAAVGRARPVR